MLSACRLMGVSVIDLLWVCLLLIYCGCVCYYSYAYRYSISCIQFLNSLEWCPVPDTDYQSIAIDTQSHSHTPTNIPLPLYIHFVVIWETVAIAQKCLHCYTFCVLTCPSL